VAFAVTRSCAEGTSTICGCDSHHKGPPGDGWKWGGCSEDADFGVLVSREFADARENRPDARSAMNRHNNEAGRTVSARRVQRWSSMLAWKAQFGSLWCNRAMIKPKQLSRMIFQGTAFPLSPNRQVRVKKS